MRKVNKNLNRKTDKWGLGTFLMMMSWAKSKAQAKGKIIAEPVAEPAVELLLEPVKLVSYPKSSPSQ